MLSFLKRKDSPVPPGAADEAASVQAARTRARRRLIGAAVLVGVGIIGFPLLFESQPRPIAVDIPIEIPAREGAAPMGQPPVKTDASAPPHAPGPPPAERLAEAPSGPVPTAAPVASAAPAGSAPLRAAASRTVASVPQAGRAAAPDAGRAAASAAEANRAAGTAPEIPHATAAPPLQRDGDAQRALALLEGKPVASATTPHAAAASQASPARFVVQAGAYTDSAALREARQKVEKLGMKTYTQVIETDAGERTRVRVGPFASRDEAEKAAARIKGSGLAVSILSL